MLTIKFHKKTALDVVADDTGLFVFDYEGIMAMHPFERTALTPEAFLGGVKLVGVATIKDKKLAYTFDQLTTELLASGIYGLGKVSCNQPAYTIIVDDLGRRTAWSRGIEQIYFNIE